MDDTGKIVLRKRLSRHDLVTNGVSLLQTKQ
jgi:hypothetical protein